MCVHPQYQKRGVGSALMARVLQLADSTNTPVFIADATEAEARDTKLSTRGEKG